MRVRILFAAALVGTSLWAVNPEPAAPVTEDVPIQYLDVIDAFQALQAKFPDIKEVVTAMRLDSNTLTLLSTHQLTGPVKKLLAEIDVRPKHVVVNAVISEVTADGEERVISRPTIHALDGAASDIAFQARDGKQFKVKVTARSVAPAPKK